MNASRISRLWAKLIVEELARNGVTRFCVSPGSRSTPLILAAAESKKIKITVHYDERGAAFFALGYAKATGAPAALICTSGTALANYFPAVVEASMSFTPMIILSADRPPELRDTGASQTIMQTGIFGNYLRWCVDMPVPDEAIPAAFVLTTIDQAYYRAQRSPAGPVQINCMFREPLAPTGVVKEWPEYVTNLEKWLASSRPYTKYGHSESICSDDDLKRLCARTRETTRGVIVAGTLPVSTDKDAMIALAERLGWPLLADVSSGIRFRGKSSDHVFCHYDLYLRADEFRRRNAPDLILQFGGPPISKQLLRYLVDARCEYIAIGNHPLRHDPDHVVTGRLECDPSSLAAACLPLVSESRSSLYQVFREADDIASRAIASQLNSDVDRLPEFAVARCVFEEAAGERAVFLATSMPIREVDSFVGPTNELIHVSANRGVNGIDGTIATAAGFAGGLKLPTTLLIGDIAFLHDLNSLRLVRDSAHPITVVLINNDGGGIFSFLPVAEVKEYFEQYFAAPHGMEFRSVASQFDIQYQETDRLSDFLAAYRRAVRSDHSTIIEVVGNRSQNVASHERLWDMVRDEINKVLPT